MSHISTIKLLITDLNALRAACADCEVEFKEDQKTFKVYGGRQHRCEHAIVDPTNKRAYEVGVVKCRYDQRTESVVDDHQGDQLCVQHDDWRGGGGMVEKVGPKASKLMQRYGYHATKAVADQNGWQTTEEVQADGSIKLYCEPQQTWGEQEQQAW